MLTSAALRDGASLALQPKDIGLSAPSVIGQITGYAILSKNMDDFLGGPEPIEPAEVSSAVPEAAPVEAPATEPKQPEPQPEKPEQRPAKPDAPEVPEDVAGLRQALQATRKERSDHKGRADRLEGEMKTLREQLEAAQRAPAQSAAPPALPQPVSIPNPAEDPAGYHAAMQQSLWSHKLDMSEQAFRSANPDADTKKMADRFLELTKKDAALAGQLRQQAHPYQFVADYLRRVDAMAEIGEDPSAYKARLAAELRAQWEAEQASAQPTSAPPVNIPSSLSGIRSAAPRASAPANTPTEWGDILARKKRAG